MAKNTIAGVPPEAPEIEVPPQSNRSLMTYVHPLFYTVYGREIEERKLLMSTNQDNSPNRNVGFDRCKWTDLVIAEAEATGVQAVINAPPGLVWQCISKIINKEQKDKLSLKVIRKLGQYQQAAE